MPLEERIKQIIGKDERFIIGFANLSGLLHEKYKKFPYAIVIGKKLDDTIIDAIESGPNIKYYRHYRDTNRHLSRVAHKISVELKTLNISTIIIEPTVSDDELDGDYYQTLRMEFSHKMAATRAGLGWIGKTDLFISKSFGPRLRLATLLTDYPFQCPDEPINESMCGSCLLCVKKCPAQAANGKSWNIDVDRDAFYNPFKCREKCLELSWQNMKKDVSICGICVSVCPVGRL